MTYQKRPWFDGAILHATARGNHKNDIFNDDEDFETYLNLLEESLKHFQSKFIIYSYCLMNNHIHLLIKTDNLHICNFISRINSSYAHYFNKKNSFIGHLFQDRYFTELVDNDSQLLTTSRYIHLNPIRAHIVKNPEDYKWSSYSLFLGLNNKKIVQCKSILDYFGTENARNKYKEFVDSEWGSK